MHVVSLTGASSVTDPDLGAFEANADGVFDVPEELGSKLVGFSTDWRTEAAHAEHLALEEAKRLADPAEGVKLLTELRDRIGSLEAEVHALRKPRKAPANLALK